MSPKRNHRPKADVVRSFEERHAAWFIDATTDTEHGHICRCGICFEKAVDALLEHSERTTQLIFRGGHH
jgi:hypothetical protein